MCVCVCDVINSAKTSEVRVEFGIILLITRCHHSGIMNITVLDRFEIYSRVYNAFVVDVNCTRDFQKSKTVKKKKKQNNTKNVESMNTHEVYRLRSIVESCYGTTYSVH